MSLKKYRVHLVIICRESPKTRHSVDVYADSPENAYEAARPKIETVLPNVPPEQLYVDSIEWRPV